MKSEREKQVFEKSGNFKSLRLDKKQHQKQRPNLSFMEGSARQVSQFSLGGSIIKQSILKQSLSKSQASKRSFDLFHWQGRTSKEKNFECASFSIKRLKLNKEEEEEADKSNNIWQVSLLQEALHPDHQISKQCAEEQSLAEDISKPVQHSECVGSKLNSRRSDLIETKKRFGPSPKQMLHRSMQGFYRRQKEQQEVFERTEQIKQLLSQVKTRQAERKGLSKYLQLLYSKMGVEFSARLQKTKKQYRILKEKVYLKSQPLNYKY